VARAFKTSVIHWRAQTLWSKHPAVAADRSFTSSGAKIILNMTRLERECNLNHEKN
jgi:hypothetical protein